MQDAQATVENVCEILQRTLSHVASIREPAEKQLLTWETKPNFLSLLLIITFGKNHRSDNGGNNNNNNNNNNSYIYEENVRKLAAITAKQVVMNNWTRTIKPTSILPEERVIVRNIIMNINNNSNSNSFVAFCEPVASVAVQIALMLSKIARIDYPFEWPELMPFVANLLKNTTFAISDNNNNNTNNNSRIYLIHSRAILTLHHIIKELMSKRILIAKQEFQTLSPMIFPLVVEIWKTHIYHLLNQWQLQSSNNIINNIINNNKNSATNLTFTKNDEAYLLIVTPIKLLRGLYVYGFNEFHTNNDAVLCIQYILNLLKQLLTMRTTTMSFPLTNNNDNNNLMIDKIICWLSKLLLQILKQQQVMSLVAAGVFEEIVLVFYQSLMLVNNTESLPLPEKYLVNAMQFLQEIYKDSCDKLQKEDKNNTDVNKVTTWKKLNNFMLTPTSQNNNTYNSDLDCPVALLFRQLIIVYLQLNQDDMNEWRDNPESYFILQESDSMEDKLKPCAERFLLILIKEYKSQLTTILQKLLIQAHSSNASVLNCEMGKDCVYHALGVVIHDIDENILNFQDFYVSTFKANLINSSSSSSHGAFNNLFSTSKIIRSRVAYLIGCGTSLCEKEQRLSMYQILIPLLQDKDTVVRISAAAALRYLVDDVFFDPQLFAHFFEVTVVSLFELLEVLQENNNQGHILNSLNILLEQMRPELGKEENNHVVVKISEKITTLWQNSDSNNKIFIINVLIQLTNALNANVHKIYHYLIPIALEISNPANDDYLILSEDAMSLIQAILLVTPVENNIPPVFYNVISNIHQCLVVLGDHENVETQLRIAQSLVLLGKRNFIQNYSVILCQLLIYIINPKRFSDRTKIICSDIIDFMLLSDCQLSFKILLESGILLETVKAIATNGDGSLVSSAYYVNFARILYLHANLFQLFFQQVAPNQGIDLTQFLKKWVEEALDTITELMKRKLMSLALCRILSTPQPAWLEFLPTIIDAACWVCKDFDDTDQISKYEYEVEMKLGNKQTHQRQLNMSNAVVDEEENDGYDSEYRSHEDCDIDYGEPQRRLLIFKEDEVYTADLKILLVASINQCRLSISDELFNNYVTSRLDPAVMEYLNQIMKFN